MPQRRAQLPPRAESNASTTTASPPGSASGSGRLLWPDGRQSAGTIVPGAAGPRMQLRPDDPVLLERKPDAQGVPPKPIDVHAVGSHIYAPKIPGLNYIAGNQSRPPTHLPTPVPGHVRQTTAGTLNVHHQGVESRPVSVQSLGAIVRNASTYRDGLSTDDRQIAAGLFGHAVESVAAQAQDPAAMRQVAHALKNSMALTYQTWNDTTHVHATFDLPQLQSRVDALKPGQSAFINVNAVAGPEGHALGLAIQRDEQSQFRVSALNSMGWDDGNRPALSKTVSRTALASSLERLLSDASVYANPHDNVAASAEGSSPKSKFQQWEAAFASQDWISPFQGKPLRQWHEDIPSAAAGPTSATSPRQTPQKNDDCGIENSFAFMATTLNPSDYKLAKAACLGSLHQIAQDLEASGASDDLTRVKARLAQRTTSALRGNITAPPVSGSKPSGAPPTDSQSSRGAGTA